MLHYYLSLPKGQKLDFDRNITRSIAIQKTAENFFEPYETYLKNAIKAMDNKAQIKARWEPCNTRNLAELRIVGGLYEVSKQTKIQIKGNETGCYRILSSVADPEFNEKLKYKAGDKKGEIDVNKIDFDNGYIRIPIETETFDKIIWGFNTDIHLEPSWLFFQSGEILHGANNDEHRIVSVDSDCLTVEGDIGENAQLFYRDKEINYIKISGTKLKNIENKIEETPAKIIFYSEIPVDGAKKFDIKKISNYINFHEIYLNNGAKLDCEHEDGLTIILTNESDIGKTVVSNGIKYNINKIQENGKDAYWIQLSEITPDAKEELNGLSTLRCFFDDEVVVVDANSEKGKEQIKYKVEKGSEEENKIVLKRENPQTKRYEYCFPGAPEISVDVNTYNLAMQLAAISTLKSMPVGEQAKLIQLFENRNKTRWENAIPENISEWFVLKDSDRSGAEQQRDFVKKAMGTPDFAILEGPPGSGKTTAILELICQLSKQGKRILLCGSTHVAIDNILERLVEKKLLEPFSIFPVRIGTEKQIGKDSVAKNFRLDELCGDDKSMLNLILDSATLVCGTTMGILQHPKIKARKPYFNKQTQEKYWLEPIVPEFDYLIIDECSKTTFQEFLVPALYTKKWILIGDVMQLSPFTDQDDIVTNLEYLSIDGKMIVKDLQHAVFILQKLIDCTKKRNNEDKNNRFILPVSKNVLKCIFDELSSGKIEDFDIDLFAFVSDLEFTIDDDRFLIKKHSDVTRLELSAAHIVFVDRELLDSAFFENLPETHALLEYGDWEKNEHSFRHNAFQQNNNKFYYRDRGKTYDNSFSITENVHNHFFDKNWADEIAWRINSAHQLRLSENNRKRESYIKQYQEFLPKSLEEKKVKDAIDAIAHIAYPSILESLSPRKQLNIENIKDIESTISAGFLNDDLEIRKSTLEYQHRMHPDISRFPREQFYKTANALRDLEKPKHIKDLRNWNYDCDGRYLTRNIWVHVKGSRVKNYNPQEAEALAKHLNKFLDYAKQNVHPESRPEKPVTWKIACLAFYRGQETRIREELQKLPGNNENKISRFSVKSNNGQNIEIRLHTVDKFQGDEADIVFLSMRECYRDGFLNNPNRLNVAITRAKFQLVIFGNHDYFINESHSDDLRALAKNMKRMEAIL